MPDKWERNRRRRPPPPTNLATGAQCNHAESKVIDASCLHAASRSRRRPRPPKPDLRRDKRFASLQPASHSPHLPASFGPIPARPALLCPAAWPAPHLLLFPNRAVLRLRAGPCHVLRSSPHHLRTIHPHTRPSRSQLTREPSRFAPFRSCPRPHLPDDCPSLCPHVVKSRLNRVYISAVSPSRLHSAVESNSLVRLLSTL